MKTKFEEWWSGYPLNCSKEDAQYLKKVALAAWEDSQRSSQMNSEILEKSKAVVAVWNQQSGRVFESMGGDNLRAIAICEAIDQLEIAAEKSTTL